MKRLAWTTCLSAVVSLGLLQGFGCGGGEQDSQAPRPNVLLVVVDTLRADHLSLYGYPRPTSPHLERLGAQAVVFENASTVMSHTLPAVLSLLTGVHPEAHRVFSNGARFRGPQRTLAERLAQAGYETAGFVSGSPLLATSGVATGFAVFGDTRQPTSGRVSARISGEQNNRRVIAWLQREHSAPFFLLVHYFDVHAPYNSPPAEHAPLASDGRLGAWMSERGLTRLSPDEVAFRPLLVDGEAADLGSAINAYDNQILRVDRSIAELEAVLEEHDLNDNTLLIVVGDHGEGLGEHGYYSHGLHLYEEQLRIPMLLRPPASLAHDPDWRARRISSPVSLLDVVPTVLSVAGLPADDSLPGRALQTAAQPRRSLLATRRYFPEHIRSKRGERFSANVRLHALRSSSGYKLLRGDDGSLQLYDLKRDPRELHNLAFQEPDLSAELSAELDGLRQQYLRDAPPAPLEVNADERRSLEALGYFE